ncbi:dTDP-glucose 4,6-dehydratase [Spirochaetia bacterium]|nr:dTDP-glucose 4,6-dehydratase [Spirochaetia bacterium]
MFIKNKLYEEDVALIASYDIIDWKQLRGKALLITGAGGLIGTFLVDVLMYRNRIYDDGIYIYALGRNKEKANIRFKSYMDSPEFNFIQQDVNVPMELNVDIDYILHGASNTHPIAYASEPINTILLSIVGTKNIFDFASLHSVKRTIFLSTVEIYGENRGDVETFQEDYCGYIDCNTLRAGYSEGKRAAEALCQAYIQEKNMDIVIARCCRVYGPTMGDDDSKVIAQFLRNARDNKDIILKSKGAQQYSYAYVADVCSALLVLLLKGRNGEAYNIADENGNITLLQIAGILADYLGKEIVFDIPSSLEISGYSKATKALLDNSKLRNLGWKTKNSIKDGLIKSINILKQK